MISKSIENLKLYHVYLDLMEYTYSISNRFVNKFQEQLIADIIKHFNEGLYLLISTQETEDSNLIINKLREIKTHFMLCLALIRTSRKLNIIRPNNYKAWSRKIAKLDNGFTKWINTCQEKLKQNLMKN